MGILGCVFEDYIGPDMTELMQEFIEWLQEVYEEEQDKYGETYLTRL